MDQACLARPYLDSLTTRELARIADTCGIDIPPGLDRNFIIGELLDYARAEEENGEELAESPDYQETAPIPRRYHITFIDVMIRDPLWVFVFWEVKEHDREIFEAEEGFSGYYLRVIPAGGPVPKDWSFTVRVEPGDTARYLGFSDCPPRAGGFRVELRVVYGGGDELLALSGIFKLPRLADKAVQEGAESPSLRSLSGMNDFPILRDTERPPCRRFSPGGF
jgi:hypothetical protein